LAVPQRSNGKRERGAAAGTAMAATRWIRASAPIARCRSQLWLLLRQRRAGCCQRVRHDGSQRALSIIWARTGLPTAPIWVAWTWPPLNSSSIGIERTWYFRAVARFWSMSIFTTLARPAYSPASSSRAGAIILHGPHQGAQKSTSTGSSEARTVASKSVSLAWMTAWVTGVSCMGRSGRPRWAGRLAAAVAAKLGRFAADSSGCPVGGGGPRAGKPPRHLHGSLLGCRLPRKRATPRRLPTNDRQTTYRPYLLFL